ncbi:hypothetical protein CY0110_16792 [Crocosphaera chwakensis CCY0110]|uniref:Uncharacterized protein n=1 Tax=Crocosphaera chwakensis CCY0110 TaxID=391612 RepID=A3II40_9CHRO|nr:hypothetical protein CY0110_16792 [Crocosphaera chwakensis CCY0110]
MHKPNKKAPLVHLELPPNLPLEMRKNSPLKHRQLPLQLLKALPPQVTVTMAKVTALLLLLEPKN